MVTVGSLYRYVLILLLVVPVSAESIEVQCVPLCDHALHNDWEDACGAYPPDYPALVVQARESLPSVVHALIRFDLSAIPANATVISATLRLYCLLETEYMSNDFHVGRIEESWDASQADWCSRNGSRPWCVPGGCVAADGRATVHISSKYGDWEGGPYNEWIDWNVTDIVRAWRLCGKPNCGFCVWQAPQPGHGRNQRVHFASMDHPEAASLGPRLAVEYVAPTPATGSKEFDPSALTAPPPCTGAYGLDGSTQYLAFAPYNPGASDMTIEGWVRLDQRRTTTVFRQEQNGPTGEPRIAVTVESDGRLHVEFDNGAGNQDQFVYSGSVVPLRSWTYFAVTRESGHYQVYLNGKLSGAADYPGNVDMGCMTSPGYIGHRFNTVYPGTRYYLDGAVDDFRISSVARSRHEIARYYDIERKMVVDTGTEILWRMDGTAGTRSKVINSQGDHRYDLTESGYPEAVPGFDECGGDGDGMARDRGTRIVLEQNCPNPFNPRTTVSFSLMESAPIHLAVYRVDGSLVATLVDGYRHAGRHEVVWDGTDRSGCRVASGVYLCRLVSGSFETTRRVVLLK
jgi:hypothetical protein